MKWVFLDNRLNLFFASLILLVSLLLTGSTFAIKSSPSGVFNVTPGHVYFNWTNGTINITINSTSNGIVVNITNETTSIDGNYSQGDGSTYTVTNSYLTSGTYATCFTTKSFKVYNQTGVGNNKSGTLNATNSTLFFLMPYDFCPPGKYYGSFYVKNISGVENASINATVDILISSTNTFNQTSGIGYFRGNIPQNSHYHSYYFNTSLMENATRLTINLTGLSGDVDLFLVNYSTGNLINKSIENSSKAEAVSITLPDVPEIWEIRFYGNVSSDYRGWLFFATLNVTNATSNQIMTNLDFGSLDPDQNSSYINFTLKNEDDDLNFTLAENKEVYYYQTWNSQNTSQKFDLLVPSFATKIKVKVEWYWNYSQNVTDWDLYLRDNHGNLIGNSTNKMFNANYTNLTREEFLVWEGTPGTGMDGYWNISVLNATNGTLNEYNVTAYIWFNADDWINTNFTQTVLNGTNYGVGNSSVSIASNITLPSQNLLNGTYAGFLEYYNSSAYGWKVRIPISFTVKAGTLIIDRNLSSSIIRFEDNIGFNRTVIPKSFTVTYNNTGGYDIYYNITNSTNNALFLQGDDSKFMNFTATLPPNPIPAGASGNFTVNITINTTLTGNNLGLYRGWMFFNTTNSTNMSRQSYPFNTFNLTFQVNLSDDLNVTIVELTPSSVNVTNSSKNVTVKMQVRLMNGTIISRTNVTGFTNFTTFQIIHQNVSSNVTTLTDSKVPGSSGNITCPAGESYCYMNVTVPYSRVGGKYNLTATVSWNTLLLGSNSSSTLSGTGVNTSLIVDDVGLKLTAISSVGLGNLNETYSTYFNITVKNYGNRAINSTSVPSSKIIFMKGSCPITVSASSGSYGCDSSVTSAPSASGANFTVTIPAYSEGCWLRWKITADSVSSNTSCSYMNVTNYVKSFGNITGISITVKNVPATTTDGDGDGGDGGGGDECSTNADCTSNYYCSDGSCVAVSCPDGYIENHQCTVYTYKLNITGYEPVVNVTQGGSNTTKVTVKNEGNKNGTSTKLQVSFVQLLENVTVSVTPDVYSLDAGESTEFTVNFTASNTTEVGYHSVLLKAHVKDNESISDTQTIKLVVLPLEETKKEIEKSYQEKKKLYEDIIKQFEQITPTQASEVNYTKANRTYNSLKVLFEQIENYMSQGDYPNLNDRLKEAEVLLSRFQEQVTQLKAEGVFIAGQQVGSLIYWGGIVVVIIVIIVFLIYLLLPPKTGYHPLYGYKYRKVGAKEKIFDVLKYVKKVLRLKKVPKIPKAQKTIIQYEKPKVYAEGYSRLGPIKPGKEGIGEKLKKKLKRGK